MSADGLSTVVRNGAFVDTRVRAEDEVSACGAVVRPTCTVRLFPSMYHDFHPPFLAGMIAAFLGR